MSLSPFATLQPARVAGRIAVPAGGRRAAVAPIDLAAPHSVARFARDWDGPLHVLVSNAGLVTGGLERTREGWERPATWATSAWPGRFMTPWPWAPGRGGR